MIIYNNLGQMITGRLVYFRSVDIEQRNYRRLLWGVPDEWLYLLSVGEEILVRDISTKGRGKVERIFIPVLNDILNFYLLGLQPKNKNLKEHYKTARETLDADKMLYRKFMFWKGKIKSIINIRSQTIMYKREPNPLV